jgi:hypothetical protein
VPQTTPPLSITVLGRLRRRLTRTAVDAVAGDFNVAPRFAASDLAISAAGSTAWEMCCLGLPMVLMPIAENQSDVAASLARRGVAIRAADGDAAGAWRAALALLAETAAASPSNIDAQVELAAGELALARILRASGDTEPAGALFAAALDRLEAAAGDSVEPAVLHARTAALAGLGNVDAARPVAARLLGTGYRQTDFMVLANSLGVAPGGT